MKLRNVITNEICEAEAREDGIYIKANWSDEEKWFCYDLETLARGWEYYVESTEPLIKDEKIRKAVRAWAEACAVEKCHYDGDGGFATRWYGIKLDGSQIELDGGHYTIAELCGEEEE